MILGIGFWLLIWTIMALAFFFAWLFIVKGCESMDSGTMLDPQQLAKFQGPESPVRDDH